MSARSSLGSVSIVVSEMVARVGRGKQNYVERIKRGRRSIRASNLDCAFPQLSKCLSEWLKSTSYVRRYENCDRNH